MSKLLIVAEKPSVAADIAKALGGFQKTGDGWWESDTAIVSNAVGHLVEIHAPEAATAGRDLASLPVIPARFELQPINTPRSKSQFKLVSKLMQRSDVTQVVNACDAGREGELIFRLIYELAGCRKPVRRMWLQSMTPDAIREGYRSMRPGSEFDGLGEAARSRTEADWLVGINGTRGISRLRQQQTQRYELMNAGRVQTPTLAILVQRELEIVNFVPQDYWEVHGMFSVQAGRYAGRWFNPTTPKAEAEGQEEATAGSRLFDKAQAEAIAAKCRGVAPSSVKDESKPVKTLPPKLFDLTSLQREANKRFKFSAKRTLDIAQALYETHKATSYPRTESSALPEDYVEQAKSVLGTFAGTRYAELAQRAVASGWVQLDKRIFDNSKISDHFAIIPTGTQPSGLTEDEARIYDMVVRRFIAAFYPAAEHSQTTRITVVSGESFKSTGKVLVQAGWLQVYGGQLDDEKAMGLCAVAPGEAPANDAIVVKALKTTAPSRYTEGTLLAAMEGAGKLVDDDDLRDAMKERGLGTPATRAAIIEGLLWAKDKDDRPKEPYIVREGQAQHLVPTPKGMGLVQFLQANGIETLTSPRMTAEWEYKLRRIERGEYTRSQFMGEITTFTRHIIDVIRQKAGTLPAVEQPKLSTACPRCQGRLAVRQWSFECEGGCGFKLSREICKRAIQPDEIDQLVREGKTSKLEGFVGKNGVAFAAVLKLNVAESKAEFLFDDGGNTGSGAVLRAPCPKCKGSVVDQGRAYACTNGDFRLRTVIAGRPLSLNEAARLIAEGRHPPLDGFKSTTKRTTFSAGLRFRHDLSDVDFVFD